jgi:hypothetical protein
MVHKESQTASYDGYGRVHSRILNHHHKGYATTSARGGEDDIEPIVDSDATHGMGPNGRSISGELIRSNEKAGAISVKSKAQTNLKLSSFESQLDNTTTNTKTANRVYNTLTELTIGSKQPRVRQDNEAMINFVKGNASARGASVHKELRMFYTCEEYYKGKHHGYNITAPTSHTRSPSGYHRCLSKLNNLSVI